MEQRTCRKCGSTISNSNDKLICTDCRNQQKQECIGNILIVGGTALLCFAGYQFIKSNPEMLGKIAKTFKRVSEKNPESSINAASAITNGSSNNQKSWLSKTDSLKLEQAVQRKLIPDHVVKARKYELETGRVTVDQLLKGWGAETIIEEFPNWLDNIKNIDPVQFADILSTAADETRNVSRIDVFKNAALVTFISNSGKSKWTAFFDFGSDGQLTEKFKCNAQYENAAVLREFARNVTKRMKAAVDI